VGKENGKQEFVGWENCAEWKLNRWGDVWFKDVAKQAYCNNQKVSTAGR